LRVEPRWLTPDQISLVNRREVEETGEPFLVRDRGLLESACARPFHLWHYEQEDDTVTLAVSLLFGVATNHAFEQGNKRTGLTSAIMFMELNGYVWTMEDDEEAAYWVLRLIDHRLSLPDLAELLRPHFSG
jgi:death on curing protein